MLLFLDRLPLVALADHPRDDERPWAVPLPIVATERDEAAPTPSRPARFDPWLLDTGYTGEAHVWQADLLGLGLDPRRTMRRSARDSVSAYGESVQNWRRPADLWLFSNVPGLLDRPFLLSLSNLDVHIPPSPAARRGGLGLPLIGNRLLRRAGARVDIDYRRNTLSLWLPASLLESALRWPRRLLGSRTPVTWHR